MAMFLDYHDQVASSTDRSITIFSYLPPQVKNVRTHALDNRMESFFLAETTKYLYLLFDPDNFLHNPGSAASVVETPRGPCVLHAGGYVFNTGQSWELRHGGSVRLFVGCESGLSLWQCGSLPALHLSQHG